MLVRVFFVIKALEEFLRGKLPGRKFHLLSSLRENSHGKYSLVFISILILANFKRKTIKWTKSIQKSSIETKSGLKMWAMLWVKIWTTLYLTYSNALAYFCLVLENFKIWVAHNETWTSLIIFSKYAKLRFIGWKCIQTFFYILSWKDRGDWFASFDFI